MFYEYHIQKLPFCIHLNTLLTVPTPFLMAFLLLMSLPFLVLLVCKFRHKANRTLWLLFGT